MLDNPDSLLVILTPDDSIETAITKIRQPETAQISLLVPDGVRILQSMGACDKLRQGAQQAGKKVTLYSSDEKTCNAAQLCKLPVMRIDATVRPGTGTAPAVERRPAPSKPQSNMPNTSFTPLTNDFLSSLEQVPSLPAGSEQLKPRGFQELNQPQSEAAIFNDDLDEDWASALNEFARAANRETELPKNDTNWASDFDDLSAAFAAETGRDFYDEPEQRPRFRAEDIELTAEDTERQLPRKKRKDQRSGRSQGGFLTSIFGLLQGILQPKRGSQEGFEENDSDVSSLPRLARPQRSEQEQALRDQQRRTFYLVPLLILGGILILAAVVLLLGRGSPTIVTVTPPASNSGQNVPNIILTISDVQGQVITTTASITVRGEVTSETLAPTGLARGVVQIANRLNQQIELVQGNTVVIGINPEGKEVRYFLDANVTVPAAEDTFTGRTFGVAEAPIVAASGGIDYNLPENSALRFADLGENLNVRNSAPIVGGENQAVKVVTQADIDTLLSTALPQLSIIGIQQLNELAAQAQAGIPNKMITPTLDLLARDPSAYTLQTIPPIGQPSDDGQFQLVVSADFMGLAVPPTINFDQKLQNAVASYLSQTNIANPNSNAIQISEVAFNGQQLVAKAQLSSKAGVLAPALLDEIAKSIAGKPRAAAESILQKFQELGKIGTYQLPDAETLPSADKLQVKEQAQGQ